MRFLDRNICVFFTLWALFFAHRVNAAEQDTSLVQNFSIHYKVDSVKINPDYLNNRRQIENIIHYLNHSPRIDSITIYAYSSPEGSYRYNKSLSEKRAKAAKDFLLKHSPDSSKLNSDKIKISPLAENWPGLLNFVETEYFGEDREIALTILRDTLISDSVRKSQLKKLDEGRTWRYFINNYMPHLRAATWTCVWQEVLPALPKVAEIKDTVTVSSSIELAQTRHMPEAEFTYVSRTVAAVKTNLLYDAATAVNFAVEVPINQHFSFVYEQICPWWLTENNQYCLQFLSFGGEFRWWFAPQPKAASSKIKQRDALTGHYLGVNCWGGKADIQAGRDFGCYQFDFVSAGLSYGYSMPVGKYLNLEFSLSAGYARIPYQHYIPTEDWQILIKDTHNAGVLHYFGPTKAEISLTLPIRATFRKEVKHE